MKANRLFAFTALLLAPLAVLDAAEFKLTPGNQIYPLDPLALMTSFCRFRNTRNSPQSAPPRSFRAPVFRFGP